METDSYKKQRQEGKEHSDSAWTRFQHIQADKLLFGCNCSVVCGYFLVVFSFLKYYNLFMEKNDASQQFVIGLIFVFFGLLIYLHWLDSKNKTLVRFSRLPQKKLPQFIARQMRFLLTTRWLFLITLLSAWAAFITAIFLPVTGIICAMPFVSTAVYAWSLFLIIHLFKLKHLSGSSFQ